MLERDMEDLLATYPEDFFPRKTLMLRGRQQSFSGVGRFDLLFEDEFHTNILMELKARTAKYEDASQLAKYKEELERRGERNLLMWLVAPQIPPSVREFLDRIGIEFSEIHVAEYVRVAERHDVKLSSEPESKPVSSHALPRAARIGAVSGLGTGKRRSSAPQVETGPIVRQPSGLLWRASGCDLILENEEAFDSERFRELVEAFEQSVRSRKNASLVGKLRTWSSSLGRLAWPHAANCSLLRWVTTSSFRAAVPHAEAIWVFLFGGPAPTWYVWNLSQRAYEFDPDGWSAWFKSLRAK